LGIAFGALFAVLSSLAGFLLLSSLVSSQRKAPRFCPVQGPTNLSDHPLVSIIVTARNEEKVIERCLRSTLEQSYPNLEIIVVDDSSTDHTNQIITKMSKENQKIRAVDAGPKPQGWIGKSWACWRGYESAKGDLLLFFDADSVFEKAECIEEAVEYMASKGIDMFSFSPRVKTRGVWSISTLPIVSSAIDILYPMVKVNDPKSPRAYVFGTFILVKRKTYETIDGHRAVRELIVEDAAIAQRAKSSGFKLRIEQASEYFTTEWEHELSAIYNGLERVTSSSIRAFGLVSILNAVLLFFVAVYPLLFILGPAVLTLLDSDLLFTSLLVQIGFVASVLNVLFILVIVSVELRKVVGRVGLLPFLYPLGIVLFTSAIVTTSIKISRGKGIEWKGTRYVQVRTETTSQAS
jgi:chlorobactene glucosyltransferase